MSTATPICPKARWQADRVTRVIGIDPGSLEKVFDRFFQAENRPADYSPGSGIGLSLVRELVQLLGGEIVAKSTVGKGTTFKVSLLVAE